MVSKWCTELIKMVYENFLNHICMYGKPSGNTCREVFLHLKKDLDCYKSSFYDELHHILSDELR